MPVPPQVCGAAQVQSMVRPQPSPIRPQYLPPPPGTSQPIGVQFAGTQTPSGLQVLPVGQAAQSIASPQPVPILPQSRAPPAPLHVPRVQPGPSTQMFAVQTWPAPAQAPQSFDRWHPSPIIPQYAPPVGVQDTGVQAASVGGMTEISMVGPSVTTTGTSLAGASLPVATSTPPSWPGVAAVLTPAQPASSVAARTTRTLFPMARQVSGGPIHGPPPGRGRCPQVSVTKGRSALGFGVTFFRVSPPRRWGRGSFVAAAVLAAGCAHARGAARDEPSAEAARACAGRNPLSVFGEEPVPENALARGQAFYCLGLYAPSLTV